MKKKRKNKTILIQFVLLLLCLVSAAVLYYDMVLSPRQNREQVEQLKEDFPEDTTPEVLSPTEETKQAGKKPEVSAIDLISLQARYPDVRGWLTIPGTGIDYPVLQSSMENSEYYLSRNYQREYDCNGSLFLQADCLAGESQNQIIYGHNMNSGAMFGNLKKYAAYDYWQKHRKVFFQTKDGMKEYEIVAVLKADVSMFPFQQAVFQNQEEVEAYVEQAKAQALFETGVSGADCEAVLTLVTCSYEWKDARTIIVAVKSVCE